MLSANLLKFCGKKKEDSEKFSKEEFKKSEPFHVNNDGCSFIVGSYYFP
jgi:hypothetical protein